MLTLFNQAGLDSQPALLRRRLLLSAIVLVGLLAVDALHSLLFGNSNIEHIVSWLTGAPMHNDSWHPMRGSYEFFESSPDALLYQNMVFERGIKFQYPPSSLLLFYFGSAVGNQMGDRLLNAAGWVGVLVEALSVALIAVIVAMRAASIKDRTLLLAIASVAVFATLTFYPTLKAYSLGQIQGWLNAGFALAALAFLVDRRMLSGALVGAICLVKPQLGLFVLWAPLKRQWSFLIGWLLVFVPGALLSLIVFGLANHLDYLNVLSFLSKHGEAYFPNQSFNGLMNRLIGNGDNLNWHHDEYAPYNAIVHYLTVLTSLVLIVPAMLFPWGARDAGVVDFLIAALTFTIASPIAWEHHYGMLPVVFVIPWVLWVCSKETEPGVQLQGIVIGLSFVFASRFLPSINLLADSLFNVLQSHLYLAALAMLALLYACRDYYSAALARDDGMSWSVARTSQAEAAADR